MIRALAGGSIGCLVVSVTLGASGCAIDGASLLVGRQSSGGVGNPDPDPDRGGGGVASTGGTQGKGGIPPSSTGGASGRPPADAAVGAGGVPPLGDARPPGASGALCLKNPSFEGGVTFGAMPPDWLTCQGAPAVAPAFNAYASSDGASHLGLLSSTSDAVACSVQAELCEPLRAGEPIAFSVDLSMSQAFGPFGTAYVQIWGALTQCSKDELLWTSPLLDQLDSWKTYCGTLIPSEAYPYLVVAPSPNGAAPTGTPTVASGGYAIVDNFGAKVCN